MLDERDELIEAIARELRVIPAADAAAKARIVAAVRGHRARWPVTWWRWLRTARTVRISPLGGFAVAAGAAAAIVLAAQRIPPEPPAAAPALPATAAVARTSVRTVQFMLVAPSASHVALVGDFNGWDAHATPLHAVAARGVWAVEIPLRPGRHAYAFVVDDSTWMADPVAARAPGDDFGAPNSVIVVDAGGGGAT